MHNNMQIKKAAHSEYLKVQEKKTLFIQEMILFWHQQ